MAITDWSSIVVDEILKDYDTVLGGAKAADSEEEPNTPPADFLDDVATAPASAKMYSTTFVGAKDFLDRTGLADFDVSSIVYNRGDWDESAQEFIPVLDDNYVWQHHVLYPAMRAMVKNLKVLCVGPTGSGKTDMYRNIAAVLNQPYLRIGGRGDMESDTIFGKMIISPDGSMQFQMADFPKGFRDGWLIALDEPWKLPANITMAWQRVFERGGILQLDDMPGELKDKQIHADSRTRLVLCDNVVGTGDGADRFAATMIQDSSTLNRIDLVLELGYLSERTEVQMLLKRYSWLPETQATKVVRLANLIRDGYEKYQVGVTMSPRNLMAWMESAHDIRDYGQAFKWVMLNRYAEESEKETVKGFWNTVFGTPL